MFSAKRTDCHFLRRAKSNQKARARTCKKLPVASFCASETAETGRIANGREQGDHVSRSRLRPATSIQSSAGNTFGEASGDTCRTRFFAQDGGEKALNRCEVQAFQRKELERRLKEQPYSFADSRLWLGGNLWCLEWKRIALDSDKERFWKKKGFWLVKINSFKCS